MPYKDPSKRRAYHKEYNKQWYNTNKHTRRQKVNDRRRAMKQRFARYKEGLSCEKCGLSGKDNVWALEFNHRDPMQKSASISFMVSGGYSWERIMEEINKCSILCANCHRQEHYSEFKETQEWYNEAIEYNSEDATRDSHKNFTAEKVKKQRRRFRKNLKE